MEGYFTGRIAVTTARSFSGSRVIAMPTAPGSANTCLNSISPFWITARCGVVTHPRDWKWIGYHEIMGNWRRNRLINLDRLCWRLGTARLEEVGKNLEASLAERIARDQLKREPSWTESLAVGSVSFLEENESHISSRKKTEIVETAEDVWALQEPRIPYGRENGPERRTIGCKTT